MLIEYWRNVLRQSLMKALLLPVLLLWGSVAVQATEVESGRQKIKALYIPLADHYAALVAYERYRDKMVHADFQIEQMKNWDLLRAYFQSGEVEMAYVMSPLAMDMYRESPHFRWIGLMHRDGNALAINDLLREKIQLKVARKDRKPDAQVADALINIREQTGRLNRDRYAAPPRDAHRSAVSLP